MTYPRNTGPAPQKPLTVWVVVADAAHARILEAHHHDGELREIGDRLNAEARLQPHEAQADRAGQVMQGSHGGAHAFEPRQSYEDHVAAAFARQLGRELCEARQKGAMQRLYLLADPAFLGHLRAELDAPTQALVVEERAADLVRHPLQDIRKALPERL